MTLLVLYFCLAVFVSFFCSLLESVILSVSPAYIAVSVQQGRRSGLLLKELKDQIDRPLAAILTLNTIANTIGAAGIGAQVNIVYGNEYVALASGILTFIILVFSEIIPKTLGASNWKKLAPICGYFIRILMTIAYPFVLMSEFLYRLLSPKESHAVTREEVLVTAEMGESDGTINAKESTIIRNLLMLSNIKVSDIMTPRSVILAFESHKSVGNILEENKNIRFSRIPVFKGDLDNILGLVHRYKILEASYDDKDNILIDKLMKPVHTVSEGLSVADSFDEFIKRKDHLFIVVDNYGTTNGIVTLEDAIETLLGVEIVDEFDSVADMRQFALEKWRERKQGKKEKNE